MPRNAFAFASLLLLAAPGLQAQDVELLGRIHGTRPPEAYFELVRSRPNAFQFSRAWIARAFPGGLPGSRGRGGGEDGPFRNLSERGEPVSGHFTIPLVLGYFADDNSAPDIGRSTIAREFWEGPNSLGQTVPEYYAEVSSGMVSLEGVVFDWRQSELTRGEVTGGNSGLSGSGVADFIIDILEGVEEDDDVDWGVFDTDGPDGVPNSGDDDGYVDILTVMHPDRGAECSGASQLIWSHRWSLTGAGRAPFETETSSANGGVIRVNDYTIQGSRTCSFRTNPINDIGVFVHELGHGFGLPDLYGIPTGSGGVGNWGLMGTGGWGCGGIRSWRPCHAGAWTKSVLGWVDVETLPPNTNFGELELEPVVTSGKVYRLDADDGSGEYFLLENRQKMGSDLNLPGPGLLVWHIDPDELEARWPVNRVNSEPSHLSVWIRQADGENELAGRARGDSGDIFPGSTENRSFHTSSQPSSNSHEGRATGVTISGIFDINGVMKFKAVTGSREFHARMEGYDGEATFLFNGQPTPSPFSFVAVPFETHVLVAPEGRSLGEGIRRGFLEWENGWIGRRRRLITGFEDDSLVASYGGREFQFSISLDSPVEGVVPGRIALGNGTVDGWAREGAEVRVRAVPHTGFSFEEWSGALAGSPNPVTLVAEAPLEAAAHFRVTLTVEGNPDTVRIVASEAQEIVLGVENANLPVRWTLLDGSLPAGLELDPEGTIEGVPLVEGSFPVTLGVRDAIGIEARISMTLEVTAPTIPVETMLGLFFQTGNFLSVGERAYLDWVGNRNGSYDVGDFRAYLLANPDAPASASSSSGDRRERVRIVVPLIDLAHYSPPTPREYPARRRW